MAEQKNILTGAVMTVEDKAIAVSIERYNELIRKEALLDKLMEGKDVSIYLYQKMEGIKTV